MNGTALFLSVIGAAAVTDWLFKLIDIVEGKYKRRG